MSLQCMVGSKGGPATDRQTSMLDFTEEQRCAVDAIIDRARGRPGALIPVLEEVQGVLGYLPESAQRRVSSGLGLPLSRVYGVVTFYSFFTMKPRGRHNIRVCLGTACHVAGATDVLARIQELIHCEPGEMSRDGVFSLEVVRCLGACGLAPVVHVDEDTHSQVRPNQVEALLRSYRSGHHADGLPEAEPAGSDGNDGMTSATEGTGPDPESAVESAETGDTVMAGAKARPSGTGASPESTRDSTSRKKSRTGGERRTAKKRTRRPAPPRKASPAKTTTVTAKSDPATGRRRRSRKSKE